MVSKAAAQGNKIKVVDFLAPGERARLATATQDAATATYKAIND